jgi:hypothetical protein
MLIEMAKLQIALVVNFLHKLFNLAAVSFELIIAVGTLSYLINNE